MILRRFRNKTQCIARATQTSTEDISPTTTVRVGTSSTTTTTTRSLTTTMDPAATASSTPKAMTIITETKTSGLQPSTRNLLAAGQGPLTSTTTTQATNRRPRITTRTTTNEARVTLADRSMTNLANEETEVMIGHHLSVLRAKKSASVFHRMTMRTDTKAQQKQGPRTTTAIARSSPTQSSSQANQMTVKNKT
jgi:hypothetical protein